MNIRNVYLVGLLLLSLFVAPVWAQEDSAEPDLRIGSLPILGQIPLRIAEQAGYFAAAGVTVELVTIASGSGDIEAALLAEELDGALADVVFALEVNEAGGDLRIVRHVELRNLPNYAIMVGPGSELESVADLVGKRLAVSRDVHYLADALLASAGIHPDEVEYVDVPGIPVRLEQTVLREVDAGLLLDYPAQGIQQYDAEVLLDDAVLDYVPRAISFRAAVLTEKGEAVRAFLSAYERAVETLVEIRGDTQAYRQFVASLGGARRTLMENAVFSGQISAPIFTAARVPSESDFTTVQDWALGKGVLAEAQAYSDVVDDSFLPEVMADDMAEEDMMADDTETTVEAEGEGQPAPDLRIGLLPVLNALPAYIALDAGYYEEEGLVVELRLFLSAKELTATVIAGGLDGLQADLVSALRMNASGGDVRVVRHVGITNQPFVSLIISPRSGIESVADLAGARIGLSHNTIIQYLTDSLLAGVAMSAADVEYVEVAKILERYNDLLRGDIDAASLPEPFASLASSYGGRALVDDSVMSYVPEALSIRSDVLMEKGEAIRAFLRAYERAVATLNAMEGDNSTYREFSDAVGIQPNTMVKTMVAGGILPVPSLSVASVPSMEDYATVHGWALGNGLLSEAQAYEDVVDGSYLPEMMDEE